MSQINTNILNDHIYIYIYVLPLAKPNLQPPYPPITLTQIVARLVRSTPTMFAPASYL